MTSTYDADLNLTKIKNLATKYLEWGWDTISEDKFLELSPFCCESLNKSNNLLVCRCLLPKILCSKNGKAGLCGLIIKYIRKYGPVDPVVRFLTSLWVTCLNELSINGRLSLGTEQLIILNKSFMHFQDRLLQFSMEK